VRLLPAWRNPFAVFFGNLWDLILGRLGPLVELGPGPKVCYWPNLDWRTEFPWRGLKRSAYVHAALLGLMIAASIWPQAQFHLASRAYRYQLSLYLPEMHGARTHRKVGGKADPVLARQEIRSVPDAPDNARQTIVTPPDLKLRRDVALPNLVGYKASGPAPPAPPLDVRARTLILQLPAMLPELAKRVADIVQPKPQRAPSSGEPSALPAPNLSRGGAPRVAELLPPAANPALPVPRATAHPEIVQLKPQRAPSIGHPRVLAAPEPGTVSRGSAPLAELLPAANPALPAPRMTTPADIVQLKPQRAPSSIKPTSLQPAPELGTGSKGNAADLSQLLPQRAEPGLPGPKVAEVHMPEVLALSAHPAEVQTPAAIPEGNRRGAFAASPEGHADATGAPGKGDASGIGAHEVSGKVNAPPGISVGAPPIPGAAVAAPNSPSPNPAAAEPNVRSKLMAAMRANPNPIASMPPRQPQAHETASKPTELENRIFAGRRTYTLVVNMPNLNVRIGSWIIRYVDRKQGLAPEPITAPEVVSKTDPAFPSELVVHGVVILTAIIRADGSVGDITVVQSLYPQLDQNAAEALSRWVFRPALKNGEPVELEALITVPFRTSR
jgi:periplasmic protein TonB